MHLIVCIKSVVAHAPGGRIDRSAGNCTLNPFDRPALEAALRLKAQRGGTLTALSMGPPTTEAILREAMAMGADRAVLLCDPALAGSDTLATSTALGAAARVLAPFDLLLFGMRSADSDTGQVGPQTAVLMEIPVLTGVVEIDSADGRHTVSRQVDGYREVYTVTGPAALTIRPEMARHKETALGGLAVAFDEMPVERLTLGDVGLLPEQVGDAGSPTRVRAIRPISKGRMCRRLEGTPVEQAEALVRHLAENGLIG